MDTVSNNFNNDIKNEGNIPSNRNVSLRRCSSCRWIGMCRRTNRHSKVVTADTFQSQEIGEAQSSFSGSDDNSVQCINNGIKKKRRISRKSIRQSISRYFPKLTESEEAIVCRIENQNSQAKDILEAMRSNPKSSLIQGRGCAILTTMAKDVSNHDSIILEDGISVILDAMRTHDDIVEVQGQACSALGNLAAFENNTKLTVASNGGIELIVKAMEMYPSHSGTQERACGALFNLAFLKPNKVKIASAGGISAVVKAMQTHSDDASIQHHACCALWNLASDVQNSVHIASEAGIPAIVKGMETHQYHPKLQHSASGLLRTLAINSDNKFHIASAGGVPALIDAMEMHPNSSHVQKEACGALRNLVFHPSIRHHVQHHKPHKALEAAADRFPLECGDSANSVLDRI